MTLALTERMLAVLAQEVIERLAHQRLEAGISLKGEEMQGPADFGGEVSADRLLPDPSGWTIRSRRGRCGGLLLGRWFDGVRPDRREAAHGAT